MSCIAALVLLAACGDDAPDPAELSRIHCRAALGWMTKGIGTVKVERTRDWMVGGDRFVSILYDLTPVDADSADAVWPRSR